MKNKKRKMISKKDNFARERVTLLETELQRLREARKKLEGLNVSGIILENFDTSIHHMTIEKEFFNHFDEIFNLKKISKKIQITEDIYFEMVPVYDASLTEYNDSFKLCGRFYFEEKTIHELYETFYSSYSELNKILHNTLKRILLMVLASNRDSLTWTFNYSENIYEDYRIKKHEISTIMNMLNDKESWQFKLLKEIAEKLVKNIKDNYNDNEYNLDWTF